ncbi:MAG: hypothetical protein HY231_16705 [Acidobacteria bacterium]|nr:hypothetical protein [Acidobacteriota bacterium]
MIRINKPKQAPNILTLKGKAERRALSSAYSRAALDYQSGKKIFDFDSTIYGHQTVKSLLIKAQHGKCFICESKFAHVAYGDVEHFRPKAGYKTNAKDKLQKPGYYWLAYEWSNLFASCQICNQRFKRNLFPLLDESKRAKAHRDNIRKEEPLFINPAEENPEKFITFKCWEPQAINGNPRGEATIKMLGLDRRELNDRRIHHYNLLSLVYALAIAEPPQSETEDARALLVKAVLDNAEFAGMIRAAVGSAFSKEGCAKAETS